MPRFSVNWGSNRPGGVDIVLAGLARQTFEDFEVVFVDGLYHERHAAVLDEVRRVGLKQPFFHVPNHRFQPGIWGTTCAGYNTGFALSDGEFVVMLLDYGYAPPRWLEEHEKHQASKEGAWPASEGKIILGPHEYRVLTAGLPADLSLKIFDRKYVDQHQLDDVVAAITRQRVLFGPVSCFATPFEPSMLEVFPVDVESSDTKCRLPTQEWFDVNFFATKNESFPTKNVLAVNGMDEHYDLGRGPGDPDLCHRLRRTGLSMWIVNEAMVHCLNPRGVLPNMNIIIGEGEAPPPPYSRRWCMEDGYTYFAKSKLRQSPRAVNPFEIEDLRREIWNWRELSQTPTVLIPKRVVLDDEYWKKFGFGGSNA